MNEMRASQLYLLFGVGETDEQQYWALSMEYVIEIVQNPTIYPIPLVPQAVKGCFWYRGRIYNVVDMAQLITGKDWQKRHRMIYYIAVTEFPEHRLAFDVGEHVETISFEKFRYVESAPEHEDVLYDSIWEYKKEDTTFLVYRFNPDALLERLDRITLDFVQQNLIFYTTREQS